MSQKRVLSVPFIVEEYRKKFPSLNKKDIRKFIRLEYHFLPESADLKKLTRALQKSFKLHPASLPLSPEDELGLAILLRDLKAGKCDIEYGKQIPPWQWKK